MSNAVASESSASSRRPGASRTTIRLLLTCGVLSSALYAGMLAFIPVLWADYDSASWTVSELSAIGAPTRWVWVSLAMVWTSLYAAFGSGVWLAAEGRALRAAGIVIVLAAAFGLFWPPMHQREVLAAGGRTLTDSLHIVWTIVNGVLTLVAMGLGAVALRKSFLVYSIATMVILMVAGAMTAHAAPGVDANLPTPWIGVWERVNIGAWLLWTAALAVTLLRRSPLRAGSRATLALGSRPVVSAGETLPRIGGFVAPGFEEVRVEFERNFSERGEIGAAVAAYFRGEKVVDLWGGRRTPEGEEPWNEDTMIIVMSTTKGLAAMTLALANSRGWLDYDAKVASYWPEFAQNGKADITVRQLLGHEAGLVLLDETLTVEKLHDLDGVAQILARQTPAWVPGTRHGYHTMTLGLYMQELMRRVDPDHRTLGRVFHDEIAVPLGLDFYIGLPADIPAERLARVRPLSPWRGLLALRYTPLATTLKMIAPGSLLRRSFAGLSAEPNDRAFYEVEVPAGNGIGTARSIARAYAAFAEGGAELGITPETLARITAPPVMAGTRDEVLGVPSSFSLGFLRPGPNVGFGSTARAFGAPGAGGSFGFADPDQRLGYAYVMNRLDFHLYDDPREKPLRAAVHRAIKRAMAAGR